MFGELNKLFSGDHELYSTIEEEKEEVEENNRQA